MGLAKRFKWIKLFCSSERQRNRVDWMALRRQFCCLQDAELWSRSSLRTQFTHLTPDALHQGDAVRGTPKINHPVQSIANNNQKLA